MVAPADYAGVVVTSPSLRCILGAADNGALCVHHRLCAPRSNGLVVCAAAAEDDDNRRAALGRFLSGSDVPWVAMIKTAAGSAIHDGDEITLLPVPDAAPPLPHHLTVDEPFSWCRVDGEDQVLWCDHAHAPVRGVFAIWRAL
nr:hypothetical protein [Pandoravirus belohorizontensis]